MKKSIDHVAKLLAGTSVVVVSSLLMAAPAAAATPHTTALHDRTAGLIRPHDFSKGTTCRIAAEAALHDRTGEVVCRNNFGQGTTCRVAAKRDQ